MAPVLGADFSWIESGLQVRVPVHRGPRHSLDLAVMTTYTSDLASEKHLSATRRAATLPVQVGPPAQYDGEGALAVRLGIVASFR